MADVRRQINRKPGLIYFNVFIFTEFYNRGMLLVYLQELNIHQAAQTPEYLPGYWIFIISFSTIANTWSFAKGFILDKPVNWLKAGNIAYFFPK